MSMFKRYTLTLICVVLCLTACDSGAQPTPFSVTLPPTQQGILLATAIPTTIAPPTSTPTLTPSATFTLTPTSTFTETATPVPTETFTPSITPTLARVEHFYIGRPIARTGVDWVDRNYPYGTTQLGRYPVHHGVEFQNPRGTPVLAVAPGTVYHAGDDLETLYGPQLNYYGKLVVIQHDFPTPEGEPIFSLYGHLDRIEVETGQRVEAGDQVGVVGDQGVAVGPHLHFEIRVGTPYDFYATRNPEMWILPYPTFGMLAGRVTDAAGELLQKVVIQVKDRNNTASTIRYAYSYENDAVHGDWLWGENFTLGDLPEGDYEVIISDRNGKVRFRQDITVVSGKIAWVEIELE